MEAMAIQVRLSNGSRIAAAVADKVTPGAVSASTPAACSSLHLGCCFKNFARCWLYAQTNTCSTDWPGSYQKLLQLGGSSWR